jgi:hypothetical protein
VQGAYIFGSGQLIIWSIMLAFLGVFAAVPLRTQVIEREQLRFPSGLATANVIRVLHSSAAAPASSSNMQGAYMPDLQWCSVSQILAHQSSCLLVHAVQSDQNWPMAASGMASPLAEAVSLRPLLTLAVCGESLARPGPLHAEISHCIHAASRVHSTVWQWIPACPSCMQVYAQSTLIVNFDHKFDNISKLLKVDLLQERRSGSEAP